MGFFTDTFKNIFRTITKLSRPYFTFEENFLKFKITSDDFYIHTLKEVDVKTRHDPYILEAYTINTDTLYLEYIQTEEDIQWNGLALEFFLELLKSSLRTKQIRELEKKEFEHYTFLSYEIEEKYILNIIYIYEINKDVFIVDKTSKLYQALLKKFDKSYIYTFKENENIVLNLNCSLVKNNAFKNYFGLSEN